MKIVLICLGIFLGVFLLGFIGESLNLFSFGFFAPKYAKVERKIFEETPSYVQGKITQLSNYKLQYDTSKDISNKSTIKAVVQEQFGNFNIRNLDDQPQLQNWLITVRGN